MHQTLLRVKLFFQQGAEWQEEGVNMSGCGLTHPESSTVL
jgi:hypothetical protein